VSANSGGLLGELSYPIYICHLTVIAVVGYFWNNAFSAIPYDYHRLVMTAQPSLPQWFSTFWSNDPPMHCGNGSASPALKLHGPPQCNRARVSIKSFVFRVPACVGKKFLA